MSKITINLHDQPCGNCTVCIGRNIGAKHEQERIIKLLEAGCERPLDPKWEHYRESCNCWQIELIKGETNE